ncbi:unnamed protein product [Gulo gulo]|uniref:Uncharacterized protein n=1 Tax=Gulo gulo TaxID=48420 RepID=A0A9X9LG80_GULGU|nr:unnamed protein product [Gulo gulo]
MKDEHKFVLLSIERRVYLRESHLTLGLSEQQVWGWVSLYGDSLPPLPSSGDTVAQNPPTLKKPSHRESRCSRKLAEPQLSSQKAVSNLSHVCVLGDHLAQLSPQLIVALTGITLFGGMV